MIARVASVVAAFAAPSLAIDVVSRFETGMEGWTLEGPGTLDWVATGGHAGGHLRVTRTGPGEVYLVAPSSFHGNWASAAVGGLMRHQVALDFYPAAAPTRGLSYDVSGPHGAAVRDTTAPGASASRWNGVSIWSGTSPSPAFNDVTRMRIRVGMNVAVPVGEVMLIDNILFKTCAANCDGSTVAPVLTANDFMCFIFAWANNDPYCNLDEYCIPTVNDFQAFLDGFAMGCVGP